MSRVPLLLTLCLSLSLATGCASRSGCQADACERAEPDAGRMVVWWSPAMRGGLGSPERPLDHSVVTLED